MALVFYLGENAPDKVLQSIYAKLENFKVQGDQFAMKIMERLKLIAKEYTVSCVEKSFACDSQNLHACFSAVDAGWVVKEYAFGGLLQSNFCPNLLLSYISSDSTCHKWEEKQRIQSSRSPTLTFLVICYCRLVVGFGNTEKAKQEAIMANSRGEFLIDSKYETLIPKEEKSTQSKKF
ncbi:hypothetical protein Ahy_A07g035774 [Arachis hypogaea]|uniref:Uncharacterized protein n=1 Tax=Arachis hypogaea TaxID=3818 RepID=A0A445CEP5_ARAHY|nr:hypothetical protein Ahy_A07g035774 [Arachis hypogaea]